MKSVRFWLLLLAFVWASVASTHAELKVAAVFGDNMVLQQQQRVPVWGWSAPGAEVTVQFGGQEKKVQADKNGCWRVKLAKMKASTEPQALIVTAGETKTFTNILIGEVWLASGQSNMEKPIGKQSGQKPTFNAEQELAAATFPNLRIFKIQKALATAPLTDLGSNSGWRLCSSNALEETHFSAAAYFFGREIHTNQNVPVGLIESSWGGTRIEPWTPPVGFALVPTLTNLATSPSTNKVRNTTPTALYNAMIAPVAGFGLRGALWYQGESNLMGTNDDHDYLTYADKMTALVGGWRKVWEQGDFPFYFVQIAPYKYCTGKPKRTLSREALPEFWTLQSRAERGLRNTGMAVTTDLVDDLNDIHPRDKASVGHRLALLARNRTYAEKAVVCSGPVFRRLKISGPKLVLLFDHAEGGLTTKDGQAPTWFSVAGTDGKYMAAEAKIAGDTVEVTAPGIADPVAVRFAWDETAQPNLVNQAGLPAAPFRSSGK